MITFTAELEEPIIYIRLPHSLFVTSLEQILSLVVIFCKSQR